MIRAEPAGPSLLPGLLAAGHPPPIEDAWRLLVTDLFTPIPILTAIETTIAATDDPGDDHDNRDRSCDRDRSRIRPVVESLSARLLHALHLGDSVWEDVAYARCEASSRPCDLRRTGRRGRLWGAVAIFGQDDPLVKTEPIAQVIQRTQSEKPKFAKRQQDLLNQRYDLANRPAPGVTMSRGKAVQDGVRVKLAAGMTWEKLAGDDAGRDQGPERLAGRLLPAAASASRSGRHDLPEAADRRNEEADRRAI